MFVLRQEEQKCSYARRAMAEERRRTLTVRWSDAGERNEVDGPFMLVLLAAQRDHFEFFVVFRIVI
jgi:hypothetical protein